MIRDAYLDAAVVAAALLREPALVARWHEPSALPDFSVAGLARHLANQITPIPGFLDTPSAGAAIPVLQYYTQRGWVTSGIDAEINVMIRRHSEKAAAGITPDALADEVDAAIDTLRHRLADEPAGRVIEVNNCPLTVEDFLLTRVMELVVHGDDLAVSLDVATPAMPPAATDATIALLAGIAAWRHGPLAVVRALARHERAPRTISAL